MEGGNEQEPQPESKSIQISIEEYEEDISIGFQKEKKQEIINLFKNRNIICFDNYDYNEISYRLHLACREGDKDYIKIIFNDTIKNETKDLTFKIDKSNQTASLFRVNKAIDELIIPRTVKYESDEYLITSITGTYNEIKTIKFAEDSAVNTFYQSAFESPSTADITVETIYFPASLNELKERWCSETDNLTKIVITYSNIIENYIFQ